MQWSVSSSQCLQVWKGWHFLHRSIANQLKVHDCCQIVETFVVRLTSAEIQDEVGISHDCETPLAHVLSTCIHTSAAIKDRQTVAAAVAITVAIINANAIELLIPTSLHI